MKHKILLSKIGIVLGVILHFAYLIYATANNTLGPNPIESLTHITGEWGLYFLLLSLLITPLRRLFHWNSVVRFRRLLGLCSFVYILVHFAIFLVFDHFFDWHSIISDIVERPYITVGFIAFVLMLPLAATSLNYWQRTLGKRWVTLHQLVYIVGLLAIVHYWWLVKADIFWPLVYGVVLSVLYLVRLYFFMVKRAWFRGALSRG
jgi:methionine sulfoxide reductase heme-binding subunit